MVEWNFTNNGMNQWNEYFPNVDSKFEKWYDGKYG